MKQKIILFLFVLLMAFVVAGCGKDDPDTNAEANNNEKESETVDKPNDVPNEVDDEAAEESNEEDEEPEELTGIETDNDHSQDKEKTADEDLKLGEIHGTAYSSEDIEYDDDKGYYVLNLLVGLLNYESSQDLDEKWVAFALPDGVTVPDVEEVPSGMVVVTLPDDHTGVALKIPNIKGIGGESYKLELPLQGEPDDNDPNENLYLYNVDGNKGHAELIGEIKSNREIDFSKMKEK